MVAQKFSVASNTSRYLCFSTMSHENKESEHKKDNRDHGRFEISQYVSSSVPLLTLETSHSVGRILP